MGKESTLFLLFFFALFLETKRAFFSKMLDHLLCSLNFSLLKKIKKNPEKEQKLAKIGLRRAKEHSVTKTSEDIFLIVYLKSKRAFSIFWIIFVISFEDSSFMASEILFFTAVSCDSNYRL